MEWLAGEKEEFRVKIAKRIKKTIFYQKIALLCDEVGISVAKMAECVKVSNATSTHWGNGSHPKTPTIRCIAAYFGVSFDYLDDDDIAVGAESAQIKSNNHINKRNEGMSKNSESSIFYQKVKLLCAQKSVTIAQMAAVLGLTNNEIDKWRVVMPDENTINTIAKYFRTVPDYLLDNDFPAMSIAPTGTYNPSELAGILTKGMDFEDSSADKTQMYLINKLNEFMYGKENSELVTELRARFADKDTEKDVRLADKDVLLAEKDKAIADRDKTISDRDYTILMLKECIAELKNEKVSAGTILSGVLGSKPVVGSTNGS